VTEHERSALKALMELRTKVNNLPKVLQDAVNMCKKEIELCCVKYNAAEGNTNISSTAVAIIALENLIRAAKPEKPEVKYQENNPNVN
jgi:hypothetical protein